MGDGCMNDVVASHKPPS